MKHNSILHVQYSNVNISGRNSISSFARLKRSRLIERKNGGIDEETERRTFLSNALSMKPRSTTQKLLQSVQHTGMQAPVNNIRIRLSYKAE